MRNMLWKQFCHNSLTIHFFNRFLIPFQSLYKMKLAVFATLAAGAAAFAPTAQVSVSFSMLLGFRRIICRVF